MVKWAHETWRFLHRQSFYIDLHESGNVEAQQAFLIVLHALVPQLPCTDCRPHFSAFVKAEPPPPPGKYEPEEYRFAKYIWHFHNRVNARLGKEQPPFSAVVDFYVNNNQDALCATQKEDALAPEPCAQPQVPKIALPLVIGVPILLLIVIIVCAVLQAKWHS